MTERKWTIRVARQVDAPALAECMRKAYSVYTSRFSGEPLPPMNVDYDEEIRSYPVWVAESNGILVGGIVSFPVIRTV